MLYKKSQTTIKSLLIFGILIALLFVQPTSSDTQEPVKDDYVELIYNTELCSNACEQVYRLHKLTNKQPDNFNIIVKDLKDTEKVYEGIDDKIKDTFKKTELSEPFLSNFKLWKGETEYYIGQEIDYDNCDIVYNEVNKTDDIVCIATKDITKTRTIWFWRF